jgi:hypothetical protein
MIKETGDELRLEMRRVEYSGPAVLLTYPAEAGWAYEGAIIYLVGEFISTLPAE